MPKFIVNPDSDEAWDFELKPGANLLGRSAANDFQVDHPSVADVHCQVTVANGSATLKDLGSTGTRVDGEPVSEAVLRNGQVVELGEVRLRFEADADSAEARAVYSEFCRYHPKAAARYQCPSCKDLLCDLCVNRRNERAMVRPFCRRCGAECAPVRTQIRVEEKQQVPFAKQIAMAFKYPFNEDGAILLGGGAALLGVIAWMSSLSVLFSLLGMILMLILSCYMICYFQRMLVASASGEDKMPDWPDFSGFGDLVSPVLQFVGTLLVSFGPWIILPALVPEDAAWKGAALIVAFVFGCFYFPIAFLAVSMADSLLALNPLVIIASIVRIFGSYVLAVLVLAATYAASEFGRVLLERFLTIPIVPLLLSQFVGLYLLAVEMRILGVLYLHRKQDLRWFSW